MARFNFNFVGTIGLNGLDGKNPYFKDGVGKDRVVNGKTIKGKPWARFSCSVSEAKNNRAFCELMGNVQDTIQTYDTDGNKIEVSWDDRFDSDIIDSVANYRKHTIDLGGENNRHTFITDYDFVKFLAEHADEIKDKKFTVTGQVQENVYNGTISQRFSIQNMYAAADDVKNKLTVTMDLFWTVDDYDFADFKSEKKMYINGYVNTYIDKNTLGTEKGANKYVSQQVIFDMSKIDWDNEQHCKITDYKLAQMGVKKDGEKLATTLKKKKVYSLPIICGYLNGQEALDFSIDMLTPNQRMAVELGLKTLQECAPKGTPYGERVIEYRVRDFDLRDEFADGALETDMTVSDFEDEMFVMVEQETIADIEAKVEKAQEEEVASGGDEELADLFG